MPVGSRDWLLSVISAISVRPPEPPAQAPPLAERRARLEQNLLEAGLAYGTGAVDPAVELPADAPPGTRAFAHLIAGLVRTCAQAGALCRSAFFAGGGRVSEGEAVDARRRQLIALLAAVGGHAKAAAPLFDTPLGVRAELSGRLAGRVAARLSRLYLTDGGPFAGLPLHNGLCAIEVRAAATLALAAFHRGRLSPTAAHLATRAALAWRVVLVELLAGLSRLQENGKAALRSYDQVVRTQRLPAREARLLRRGLRAPRMPEELAPAMHGRALRRFALEQVLLAALVDRPFEAGEIAFVERLAGALRVSAETLAGVEAAVAAFYQRNTDALLALRRAELPEGLPHLLTTRVQEAVLDNLDRVLQEIRETGELAELLAKGASGAQLTSAEKAKVREQLIDLAKTIPALAIFAAPGGMLLLPILIKLLPFNLLPSSFADDGAPRLSPPPPRSGSSAPPPGGGLKRAGG